MRRWTRSGLRESRGFTLIEMIIVFVVAGVMLSIMVKSVRGAWLASSRRSASREVAAYLVRTRAIAIQQSRTAMLVRSGDVLKIIVDSSGTPVQLGTTLNMFQRYGVTLTSPKDTIYFDPRGFVANVTLTTPKLIVRIGTAADTLCVSGVGRITTRSCP